MGLGDALTNIWENYTPVGLAYKKFYKDPADTQKAALDKAQSQSFAEADKNRQFQLQGLDRALTFYGPARNVLSEMLGGAPAGGYGQLTSPPPQFDPGAVAGKFANAATSKAQWTPTSGGGGPSGSNFYGWGK